jgi:hypothetical protein
MVLECSSAIQQLPSKHKALGLIARSMKKDRKKGEREGGTNHALNFKP